MYFQVAVLCDAATDHAGKLNILGAFDTIVGNSFPLVHPQCSVALRIVFTEFESGDHKVQVNMLNEDGEKVIKPIELGLKISAPRQGFFVSRNVILNWQRLKVEKPGEYSVDVAVDNKLATRIPLQVLRLSGKKAPGQ
jgi:hypothetical protein